MIREEEITVNVDNLTLRGRAYLPQGHHRAGEENSLLILCHGIPRAGVLAAQGAGQQEGVEGGDGGYPALARLCAGRGLNAFHFNFRGTGESGGDFDLLGWTRDLAAFLDYWEQERGIRNFSLWGFSAGAAVSSFTASTDRRVQKIVLAACPAGFQKLFPPEGLEQLLLRFRETGIIRTKAFPPDPQGWLKDIHAVEPLMRVADLAPRPLLLVHGTADELIPYSHAFHLFRRAGRGRQLLILPGARHQLRKEKRAVERCLQWLADTP